MLRRWKELSDAAVKYGAERVHAWLEMVLLGSAMALWMLKSPSTIEGCLKKGKAMCGGIDLSNLETWQL